MNELIETEECMNACGVERMTVGMSTDSLAERGFTNKLCSPRCYNNCPNIVDLYFNLAAGEGTYYSSSSSQFCIHIHTPYIVADVK
jgi:hypothetical protein